MFSVTFRNWAVTQWVRHAFLQMKYHCLFVKHFITEQTAFLHACEFKYMPTCRKLGTTGAGRGNDGLSASVLHSCKHHSTT